MHGNAKRGVAWHCPCVLFDVVVVLTMIVVCVAGVVRAVIVVRLVIGVNDIAVV